MNGERNSFVYVAIGLIALVLLGIFIARRDTDPVLPADINTNGTQATSTSGIATSTQGVNPAGTSGPSATGVATQKLRVISPNGGEVWQHGKEYQVRWDTTGIGPDEAVYVNIVKTGTAMKDPYISAVNKPGSELFVPAIYPKGLPKEGVFTYKVPTSLPAGTYQILLFSGTNCSVTNTTKKCIFDVSDGLITVKQ